MTDNALLSEIAMTSDPMLDCLHMLLGEEVDVTAAVVMLRDVRLVYVVDSLYRRIDAMESAQMRELARSLIHEIPDNDVMQLTASPALCEIVRCNLADSRLLSLLERAA